MDNKQFKTICKKGQGNSLGTLLRQLAYNNIQCWRPVGYRIDDKATSVLHTEGDVVQDMVEFAYNLAELQFEQTRDVQGDFLRLEYKVKGALNSNDMKGDFSITCLSEPRDILNVLNNEELIVIIYFRKSSGVHSVDDNLNFLADKGCDTDAIKVMASTHSVISKFTMNVEETSLEEETLTLDITSKTQDTGAVLKDTIKLAMQSLDRLLAKID